MSIPNGLYFSPDGGNFEALDGTLFWESGDVMKLEPGSAIRCLPADHGQRFSQWTDEQRASAKKEVEQRRAYWDALIAERDRKRAALLASVRAKITPEEFAALGLEDE